MGLLWFVFLRTLTYSPVLVPPTTKLVKRSKRAYQYTLMKEKTDFTDSEPM